MDTKESFGQSDEEFDPLITVELEKLNQAASDVNRLEKEINEARSKYQETFCECSQELEVLRKKFGRKIKKARCYYETKELSKEAQSEAMLSARKFQSANGVYMAAKETISLAELRLKDDKAASLSTAWQEMLNHALIRVMESEQEKSKSEKEHLEKSAIFAATEKKLHILEKKHKKSIEKAKSYFDSKNELELKLQQIKQSIEDLQQAIQHAKSQYSTSLRNLETISDGIHEARRQKLILMYPREPGVGAEEEPNAQLNELPRDFDMASSVGDEDECYSDSDEELDEQVMQKMNNCSTKENHTSCKNTSHVRITEKPIQLVGVKTKQKLKKSMSLPSYVVEEETEDNIIQAQAIEIETNTVLLTMETNRRDNDYRIPAQEPSVDKASKSIPKTKATRLILDPSALGMRDAVVGQADGES